MSAVLQIANYIDKLEDLVIDQRKNLETSVRIIKNYQKAGSGIDSVDFNKGLIVGGFVLSSLRSTEEKIAFVIDRARQTLSPLALEIDPLLLGRVDLFEIDLKEDILVSLKKTDLLLQERINAIHDLKKTLLSFSDEDLKEFYPQATLEQFDLEWQNSFNLF